MSESLNCVEQREEQTELEEAGGAEVRRFKTGFVSARLSPNLPHDRSLPVMSPRVSPIRLGETFTSALLWAVRAG